MTDYITTLNRLSAPFWAAFTSELMSIFGLDIFESDDDYEAAEGFLAVDFLTGTCGWHTAMVKACEQTQCEWFVEWYDKLEWYESDEFDCDVVAEVKARWKG